VGGQIHVPVALSLGKEPPIPIGYENWMVPERSLSSHPIRCHITSANESDIFNTLRISHTSSERKVGNGLHKIELAHPRYETHSSLRTRVHHRVQNGSGVHPASYPMGTRGSFPGGKDAGA
jgi:hypothetical protein